MFPQESESARWPVWLFDNERLLQVTGMYTVHVVISRKQCKMESLLLQTTDRKWYVAYRIAAIPMTLSGLQGHSPTASLFKCDFYPGNAMLARYLPSPGTPVFWRKNIGKIPKGSPPTGAPNRNGIG